MKRLNVSNDLDLEYYCYYKSKNDCKLPATPDVEELFGVSQWWPEKQSHHYFPPNYTNNSEIFNVLHLSDVHIQLRYQLGTESNCTSDPCAVPESYNEELPGKTTISPITTDTSTQISLILNCHSTLMLTMMRMMNMSRVTTTTTQSTVVGTSRMHQPPVLVPIWLILLNY